MDIIPKKTKIILITIIVVLFSLGIPNYFFLSLNSASAANFENDYIDNVSFYYDTTDNLILKFHVKTTFAAWPHEYGYYIVNTDFGASGFMGNATTTIEPDLTNGNFIAGNTYKIILGTVKAMNSPYNQTSYCGTIYFTKEYWNCWSLRNLSHPLNNTNYIKSYGLLINAVPDNTILAYYDEYPTLTTTWPENDNMEISGDFNITGTITQPSPYEYNQLMTYAYLYNPLGEYDPIGVFTIPLLATSTQQFTQPIIGLPVSNPRNIVLINELQKLEGDIITKYYRKDGGTEFPWLIRITTFLEGEAPSYPFEPPEWDNYLDIYRPSASSDGYYRLKTPTSTIEFSYNFPETYKIRITENEIEKLATSTFSSIDPDGNLRFEVSNIDASTSTINWVEAKVYNLNNILIITARFPILGLEAGQEENIGIWGQIEDFIRKQTTALLLPSQATIDKFQKTLPDIIKSKIPMSYFYEIKDIIQETNISTSTTPFPAVEVNLDGQEVELQLINFNWLEEQGYMTTLKNLMRVFLWATYFIYLFSIGTAGPKQLQFKF